MSESFAALFEESQKRSETRIGEVVTAEVVRIEHSFVVVNADRKSTRLNSSHRHESRMPSSA